MADYADRWPAEALLDLIIHLNRLRDVTGIKVRLLCLGRSSHLWWSLVVNHFVGQPVKVDDERLEAVAADRDRTRLYAEAAGRFAAALGVPVRAWPPPAGLGDPEFGQILAVHMAALAAVLAHQRGDKQPETPHEVSSYLLTREYASWSRGTRQAPDGMQQTLHQVTCAATLAGPLNWTDAEKVLTRAGLAPAGALINEHRRFYPPESAGTVLQPLAPGRLGEDLIALSTPGHGFHGADTPTDPWMLHVVPRLLIFTQPHHGHRPHRGLRRQVVPSPTWTPKMMLTLVETAYRWPHVASELLYPVLHRSPELAIRAGGATLARLARLPEVDLDVLEAVDRRLPDKRRADLDLAAAALSEALIEKRLVQAGGASRRATLLYEHAWRMSQVGAWFAAVNAAEDCAHIRRDLDDLPDLAHALDALSWFQSKLNRRPDAVATAEESVAVCRRMAKRDWLRFRSHLARTLRYLGHRRHDLDRADATEPLEEAVTLLRELAADDPDQYRADLAESLATLGMRLVGAGHRALHLVAEAVETYRQIVLPGSELADTLNDLGVLAVRLHRPELALSSYQESADLYRRLVAGNPDAYEASLALTLGNLDGSLATAGRDDAALAAISEAVDIYRRLAETNPVHLAALADALDTLSVRLWALDRHDDALASADEAVAICRRLAARNAETYLPVLASKLSDYCAHLINSGRGEEALPGMKEVVAIRRRLVRKDPATHRRDLAASLNSLGDQLAALGRKEPAVTWTEQAVDLYREMAAENPGAHRPTLARCLRALATRQFAAHQDGRAAIEESAALSRRLAAASSTDYLIELAQSLDVLRDHLMAGGHPRALAVAAEVTPAWRDLARTSPGAHQQSLIRALQKLGQLLAKAGRTDEALAPSAELVRLYQRLAATDPENYRLPLAKAAERLATRLSAVGRHQEALSPLLAAVKIYRELDASTDLTRGLSILDRCRAKLSDHPRTRRWA
ncbi:tetratricopeptide repeat protein [Actinoplanes bogorensis]|uniref:Tetratricopeptide repeat protein n=1 Tax=Paractinoplanes bogorensis TaxID=1610840 RepID=A0ABS5Z578_9ACTN|nr:tetratricopeptide repeat protein [Actinoplanes bogorensis]MBU2669585.1 tetratricopeptide repeat protein [Actinoplanes bogorensis]